ncbi:radical SAM protein [Parendozoicomonas haliclonae]|uniref:radical SAM protein n=1 Tax=Parendozoicomonas haliclonae TaxID=1960125 RepID=UPI0039EF3021
MDVSSAVSSSQLSGFKCEFGDQGSARFDALGAWCSAHLGDDFFRRLVDGRILKNNHLDSSVQAEGVQARLQLLVEQFRGNPEFLSRAQFELISSVPDSAFSELDALYPQTYPEGVPVLPPDRYRDWVVPVTTGCPNGQCSFCVFYRDKPFQVMNPSVIGTRMVNVRRLVNESRSGVFLGSANALALPFHSLQSVLSLIQTEFPVLPKGIACFADADNLSPKVRSRLKELAEAGLSHVVVGLETGSSVLRGAINKRGDTVPTEHLIRELKQAGCGVGVTVLTGFLAADDFEQHCQETRRFFERVKLDTQDRIYISPWFASDEGKPAQRAINEMAQMKATLQTVTRARVTAYSSHNFYYFT